MREKFLGWYPRTPEQLAALWDQALFVPDANILLHCLRHRENVRAQLLRLFDVLRDSLWIPYQVGLEFHKNRRNVEFGSRNAYDRIAKDCTAALNQAREHLRQLRAHPVIDVPRELAALAQFIGDFQDRIRADKGNHPTEAIADAVHRLTDLLEGRVGDKWEPERLMALMKEGEARYANKIPPGFKDSAKSEGQYDKYGDLIIWKDMIAKAKELQCPVVFISDDAKEDWWWIHRGEKLGPLPELVQEFKEGSGQIFHIYQFTQFLRIAADRYPEVEAGVSEIEKSVREDEQAKLRVAAEADAIRQRVSELETEREIIISTLSGTPLRGDLPPPPVDRSALRVRLEALRSELVQLNAGLSSVPAADT